MRYDSLPQIEARFKSEAAPFLTPFSLQIPNEQLFLKGQLYKPGHSNYFYPAAHTKERIVLHFTAGNLRSDMQSLTTKDRHVSVPFVIARDGTIYQLFPSANWSGHLGEGVGNKGTKNAQDKVTIGIELSNYAYLVPRGGVLETVYSRQPSNGKPGPVDEYCALSNSAAYVRINQPFREQSFYAAYTPEQIESTIILLRYLTAKYNIPRQFLPEDKRYITTEDVLSFKGIVSHINYRASGKWDIGPAFDWNTLINGVTVPEFVSAATTRSLNFATRELTAALTSEAGISSQFAGEAGVEDDAPEATDNEGYNPLDFEENIVKDIAPASGKVFALLTGINAYDRVRKLNGCLHDVQQVENYLKNRTAFDCQIKKLTDADATRSAVISAFEEHLAQAGKEDTVLFYYSGHGTQEEAAPVWDETDGKLECLVCYDGGAENAADFLLTDKELRYIIARLYQQTGAHIVTIFDCCHSGDNTRGLLINSAYKNDVVTKRMIFDNSRYSGAFPQRDWSEFVFSNEIMEEDVKGKRLNDFLPEGIHIQMAACESNQSAVEVNGEGVFTKKLLGALDASTGNVSYNELSSRIRQYLRFSFEQTPKIYVSGNMDGLLAAGFLNRSLSDQTTIAEVTFNAKGWQLNLGAIHGVDKNTKITIVNAADTSQKWTAVIDSVFIDYSSITINGTPDKNMAHKAFAEGLMSGKVLLELNNSNGNPAEMAALLDDIENKAGGQFEFQTAAGGNGRSADYTLHIRGGEAVITHNNDPYRPVVRPLDLVKENGAGELVETLRHISQWHFIKELQNSTIPDGFPQQPFRIDLTRIYPDGSRQKLDTASGRAIFDFEAGEGLWEGAMEIKLTNTTHQSLYVSALYLGVQFSSYLDYQADSPRLLEPGKSLTLGRSGKDRIIIRQDDFVREYNWPLSMETLKVIASTDEFSVKALSLGNLPAPYVLADREKGLVRSGMEVTKGAVMEDEIPAEFSGWMTQTLLLVFNNPAFNEIDQRTLRELMEYEETSYYAAGLYYNLEEDEIGQPTRLVLKPEIKLPEEERGLWGDIVIWAANAIETRQRRRLYNRLKNTDRLRIVAEGDSWFQYPIRLLDTLDHLYKLYAIRSYAEAADTLENYLKKKEYLEAIKTEQAQIFLVSGGGNDILGEQFQHFLRDTPAENDATPARYLKGSFNDRLDDLERWYKEMFTELHNRYPNLRILVHSYDYIVPVDTDLTPKKTSWLGRYMIMKQVRPQAERESLIRFVVDEFNKRLQKVVAAFPGVVYYINVREIVMHDSWYDEIHPTNEGFGLVADKFVAVIESLRQGLEPFKESVALSAKS
jgi:N-acetyl-anhydromuramyl-L-alanine amidase AmpD